MECPMRKYPLKQPPNHKPAMPRVMMKFSDDIQQICTVYIGAQSHKKGNSPDLALDAIQTWLVRNLSSDQAAYHHERFLVEHGQDTPGSAVWVLYWTSATKRDSSLSDLDLPSLWQTLADPTVGLWSERFTTPLARLETNYANPDYTPGLANLRSTSSSVRVHNHTLNGYWGSARDRVPDSALDLFPKDASQDQARAPPLAVAVRGLGQRIRGANPYDNLCHIRSGQFWERCGVEEREAYESSLQPTLLAGLRYLWDNPVDNGVIGLRFLRNVPVEGGGDDHDARKETCGAGFFRNLSDLEAWAQKHASHLRIWNGAIAHAKRFGEHQQLRLWHEVSILKKGEAEFEYVNCAPETGAIRYMQLEHVDELQ